MIRIIIGLIMLMVIASPAAAGGCKEAVEKETQAWLASCKASCEKVTCWCAVTAKFRKGAVYWPACLAAVAELKLKKSMVARTWEGHWINPAPDSDAPPSDKWPTSGGDTEPEGTPDWKLAECEIGFRFRTEAGGRYYFWQEDASKLKPRPWTGACAEGKSYKSRY